MSQQLQYLTAYTRVFQLGQTGLTANVQLSKNGAPYTNPFPGPTNLTEIGRGLYYLGLVINDTDTIGSLGYAITDAATNTVIYGEWDSVDQVVASSDPWTASLPGAYIGTEAGFILGNLRSEIPSVVKNSTLQPLIFAMYNATTGLPLAGLGGGITSQYTLGGGLAATANDPVEIGNGLYYINLVSGETNGKSVGLRLSHAGARDTLVVLLTGGG